MPVCIDLEKVNRAIGIGRKIGIKLIQGVGMHYLLTTIKLLLGVIVLRALQRALTARALQPRVVSPTHLAAAQVRWTQGIVAMVGYGARDIGNALMGS